MMIITYSGHARLAQLVTLNPTVRAQYSALYINFVFYEYLVLDDTKKNKFLSDIRLQSVLRLLLKP